MTWGPIRSVSHPGHEGLERGGKQVADVMNEIFTGYLQLLVDISLGVHKQFGYLRGALKTREY